MWPVLTTQPGRHSTLLRLTFAAVTHTTSCNDVRTLLRAMACVAHGVRCILLVRAASLAGPDVAAATVLTLSRDRTPYLLSISLTTKHLSIQALGEAACSCTASAVSSLLQAQLVPSDACGVWLGGFCRSSVRHAPGRRVRARAARSSVCRAGVCGESSQVGPKDDLGALKSSLSEVHAPRVITVPLARLLRVEQHVRTSQAKCRTYRVLREAPCYGQVY